MLGAVGHTMPAAVADLVDNSINFEATRINIQFGRPDAGNGRWMTISDNGTGIPGTDAPLPGSQGIAGMHERMHDLGGECEISAGPDGGTVVHLTLPLRSP